MLPLSPTPPTGPAVAEWFRKAAGLINSLISRAVMKDGATIYTAPTASASYSQAEMQALMNAVEALSDRVK